MRYVVYCIKNTINNKVYVGYTAKSIDERFSSHLKNARNKVNRRIYDSMNYYGYENFIIFELDETNTRDKACEMESWYIYLLDSKNPERGYNMTWGGDGGNTLSEWEDDDKKKLYDLQKKRREETLLLKYGVNSPAKIDTIKEKISNSHKGKKLSEQHKKRISNTLKEKIQKGEIAINTVGLKHGHVDGQFKHSEESKNKISKVRKGKKYEDLFEERMVKELKEMHRKKWTGASNPNYVENVTDDELCYVLKSLIDGKNLNEISAYVGKSHYKIKQRLSKEGIQNVQSLRREDDENFLLTQILQKYGKKN